MASKKRAYLVKHYYQKSALPQPLNLQFRQSSIIDVSQSNNLPSKMLTAFFVCVQLLIINPVAAFAIHPSTSKYTQIPGSSVAATRLRAGGQDDAFSDITSSLARLDNQWKIQQAGKGSRSRWSKLILPQDKDAEPEEIGAAQEAVSSFQKGGNPDKPEDYVWVLDPPGSSIPSCILVFTGGAALGQFPQVAYNELLLRVSDKLNALVIAAPYTVNLDHFALAKQTGERLRRALLYLEDDQNRPYSKLPPVYSLGHSLGCKLQAIYMAATGQDFDGIGFMAFNNFSFPRTIKMARSFAEELRKSTARAPTNSFVKDDVLNNIFDFAEMAVGAIGVDFTPNSVDTDRLITLRYDDRLQDKTRVFVFDKDNLDSSQEFVNACSGASGPSLCGLQGGHLAPVYFQWSMDDITGFDDGDIPPEAREMAKEAMGGFQGASFGDEAALKELVNAICDWILGRPPGRQPKWANAADDCKIPEITGSSTGPASTD
jgi:hypothetical protein